MGCVRKQNEQSKLTEGTNVKSDGHFFSQFFSGALFLLGKRYVKLLESSTNFARLCFVKFRFVFDLVFVKVYFCCFIMSLS